MKTTISGVTLECTRGDIASQPDMTAIVNAANARLRIGGGVAGAIHRAAGPGLEEECHSMAPIKPGEAVISGGHNLPNRYVIHCLGPIKGVDKPEDKLLADCYRNVQKLADELEIDSITFPPSQPGPSGIP
ncbi:MAG: macro domain-containing protein [Marinilabilia sp.]